MSVFIPASLFFFPLQLLPLLRSCHETQARAGGCNPFLLGFPHFLSRRLKKIKHHYIKARKEIRRQSGRNIAVNREPPFVPHSRGYAVVRMGITLSSSFASPVFPFLFPFLSIFRPSFIFFDVVAHFHPRGCVCEPSLYVGDAVPGIEGKKEKLSFFPRRTNPSDVRCTHALTLFF